MIIPADAHSGAREVMASRSHRIAGIALCLALLAAPSPSAAQSVSITGFPLPTAASGPAGIVAGPDGNLWFTESSGNRIGRITPAGVITEFPVPTAASEPFGIAAGPDGNLWFTERAGNQIGRITPARRHHRVPLAESRQRALRHYCRSGWPPVVHRKSPRPSGPDHDVGHDRRVPAIRHRLASRHHRRQ